MLMVPYAYTKPNPLPEAGASFVFRAYRRNTTPPAFGHLPLSKGRCHPSGAEDDGGVSFGGARGVWGRYGGVVFRLNGGSVTTEYYPRSPIV